jgi:hypothetical protein
MRSHDGVARLWEHVARNATGEVFLALHIRVVHTLHTGYGEYCFFVTGMVSGKSEPR